MLALSGQTTPAPTTESDDEATDLEIFTGWADFDLATGPVAPCQVVTGP